VNPTSDDFMAVANLSDFPVNGVLPLEVGGRYIVLVKIEQGLYCLDDVCTHDGGPLGEGDLQGHCLVCPRHGAQFDVRNGQAVTMPATEPTSTHQVRIEGDQILVRLAD